MFCYVCPSTYTQNVVYSFLAVCTLRMKQGGFCLSAEVSIYLDPLQITHHANCGLDFMETPWWMSVTLDTPTAATSHSSVTVAATYDL